MFSAFHHFTPAAAEAILADAVRQSAGIGVFEGAGKHWHEILLAWTILPIMQVLATPFMPPFRLSRLFFTFIIPLIPLSPSGTGPYLSCACTQLISLLASGSSR